jgi:hypothetical protein
MIKGGPKIIDDNLVVCLDAHDAKSYAGEPTQNYVINTSSTGGWWGDGSSQTGLGSKGAVAITDENLKYNGYDTVLWTPGTSQNCYLNGTEDFNYSETSTEWTFSAYIKYEDGSTMSSMSVYMYYPSSDGSSAGTITDVGDGWYRVRRTRTGSSNYISLAGFTGITAMKKIYISGWQLEKKQYTTPVTSPATSRSATDGWKDLSTNDHDGSLLNGTNTGVNYYRDGQVIMPVANSYLDFDGSDDHVKIDHSTQLNNAKTWEIWINIDSFPASSTYDSIFSKTANWNNFGGILLSMIYGHLRFSYGGYWADVSIEQLSNMSTNTWYQVVGTGQFLGAGSGVLMKGYLNGVYKNSLTRTEAFVPTNTNALYLGDGSGGTMNGKIGLFRVYEDILTAAEILSNYNATKERFS